MGRGTDRAPASGRNRTSTCPGAYGSRPLTGCDVDPILASPKFTPLVVCAIVTLTAVPDARLQFVSVQGRLS